MTTQDKPREWRWGYEAAADGVGRDKCPFRSTGGDETSGPKRSAWLEGWAAYYRGKSPKFVLDQAGRRHQR